MSHYTVTAERGASAWVFQCREHPGAISEGRRLADAVDLMPEAIGFVADLDPESVKIDIEPILPPTLTDEVQHAREAVASLDAHQREAARLSRQAARDLVDSGITGADAALILQISPQRVSQLVASR